MQKVKYDLIEAKNRQNESSIQPEMAGKVRWYNFTKGFGFVAEHVTGQDILVHRNTLLKAGLRSIVADAEVTFTATKTAKGLQVGELLSWQDPDGETSILDSATDQTGLQPARVKWYDENRGFGFLNTFGSSEDVFILFETLLACGFSTLKTGEAVSVQIETREDGLFASKIGSWH